MKKTKEIPINLCYQEHPRDCTFRLVDVKKGDSTTKNNGNNYLMFFLKGKVNVSSNLFTKEEFAAGDVLFLPHHSDGLFKVKEDAQIIVHNFSNATRCLLSYLRIDNQNVADKILYTCKLHIVPAFIPYFDSVLTYLREEEDKDNSSIWFLKHQEAIHIFSMYYTKKELYSFFRPMLHESIPFKSLVFSHAKYANNVNELAELCGHGIVNFRRIFREQFGIPVFEWLQQEKSKRVLHAILATESPFKEILNDYNFTSASHFNKFCKKYFGDTPTNIRKNKDREKVKIKTKYCFELNKLSKYINF